MDPLVIVKRSVSPQNWICGNDERSSRLTASFIKEKRNLFLWAHRREENNVTNSMTVCKQHNHSVDALYPDQRLAADHIPAQSRNLRHRTWLRRHCSFSVNLFLETFSLIFCVV